MIAAARYAEVALETEIVELSKGAQKSATYLAINPNGVVPALVDGDLTLWESNAIMAYVAGRKDSSLWPRTDDRYDIMRWQSWELAHFGPACHAFIAENMIKPMMKAKPDEAKLAEARENFAPIAKVLEDHLAKHDWLVGRGVTLADFAVAASLSYATPAKIPLGDYVAVRKWLARLDEIPAWAESAPKM